MYGALTSNSEFSAEYFSTLGHGFYFPALRATCLQFFSVKSLKYYFLKP